MEAVDPAVRSRDGVRISHITKQFPAPKKGEAPIVAVNDFSAALFASCTRLTHSYDDQITVLLGHNGAGKSTLINVLTGMYGPTEGDALVYGKSLVSQLEEVRRNLGVCFQENLMINVLTVRAWGACEK